MLNLLNPPPTPTPAPIKEAMFLAALFCLSASLPNNLKIPEWIFYKISGNLDKDTRNR